MVFRTLSGLIVSAFFCISTQIFATEVSINPNHPEQYTVVRGDTLWDISGKFLNYPSQWPELWSWNPQIKNPHLIYPGDTLYFSVVDGKPRLSFSQTDANYAPPNRYSGYTGGDNCVLSEADIHKGQTSFALAPNNSKLMPCIRETSMKEAVEIIPSENIAAYLSSPRVVGPTELSAAPYVVDFAGEHVVAAAGDKLYVRSIANSESSAFTVYRAGNTFKSPISGEVLGFEAVYVADATLTKEGDPATLVIDKSKTEIIIGDRVMLKPEGQFTLNYFPRAPEQSVKGNIISVLDGVSQIGKYNVVVIDKGSQDGILPGHEFDILKSGRIANDTYSRIRNDQVRLPDEKAGSLMVFRPFDRVSYALVMKANQAIHVLDKVETP